MQYKWWKPLTFFHVLMNKPLWVEKGDWKATVCSEIPLHTWVAGCSGHNMPKVSQPHASWNLCSRRSGHRSANDRCNTASLKEYWTRCFEISVATIIWYKNTYNFCGPQSNRHHWYYVLKNWSKRSFPFYSTSPFIYLFLGRAGETSHLPGRHLGPCAKPPGPYISL